jgi:hypothetical protein
MYRPRRPVVEPHEEKGGGRKTRFFSFENVEEKREVGASATNIYRREEEGETGGS